MHAGARQAGAYDVCVLHMPCMQVLDKLVRVTQDTFTALQDPAPYPSALAPPLLLCPSLPLAGPCPSPPTPLP